MPASHISFTNPPLGTSVQWTGDNRSDVMATMGDIADYGTVFLTDSNNKLFIWGERGMVAQVPIGSWIVSTPTTAVPAGVFRLPLEIFSNEDYQATFSTEQ